MAPAASCSDSTVGRALAWSAVAASCAAGTASCCAYRQAAGVQGGCIYSWAGCESGAAKITPAVCVDAAAGTVRVADAASGERGCDAVVSSGDSPGVSLAFRRRDAACASVLADATAVYPLPLTTAVPPAVLAVTGWGDGKRHVRRRFSLT